MPGFLFMAARPRSAYRRAEAACPLAGERSENVDCLNDMAVSNLPKGVRLRAARDMRFIREAGNCKAVSEQTSATAIAMLRQFSDAEAAHSSRAEPLCLS